MKEDPAEPRFCKSCGTETFYPERFAGRNPKMKITVINGTEVKGCTYHIKKAFLLVLSRQRN
jgi:hypothetical protein